MWDKSYVITGAINHVENYSNKQREENRRVRRYIPGRELGKIRDMSGIL